MAEASWRRERVSSSWAGPSDTQRRQSGAGQAWEVRAVGVGS